MPMDELIRAIGQVDAENIQDLVNAVIGRYRELYPQWDSCFSRWKKGRKRPAGRRSSRSCPLCGSTVSDREIPQIILK